MNNDGNINRGLHGVVFGIHTELFTLGRFHETDHRFQCRT